MSVLKNMLGRRFGRLTVVRRHVTPGSQRQARWHCVCDCGGETISSGGHLRSGHAASCGCIRRERAVAAVRKHGRTRTTEYLIWCAMKQRCENPKHKDYRHYGGRGIAVCSRWREDFQAFLADMGMRPDPRLSLDRIDVNGNYEPGNCRWADVVTQRLNTRRNRSKSEVTDAN